MFSTYFREKFKYQISWISVQWEPSCFPCGRTDMKMLIVALRNFANAPISLCLLTTDCTSRSYECQNKQTALTSQETLCISITILYRKVIAVYSYYNRMTSEHALVGKCRSLQCQTRWYILWPLSQSSTSLPTQLFIGTYILLDTAIKSCVEGS
jgi:hypothetical protein